MIRRNEHPSRLLSCPNESLPTQRLTVEQLEVRTLLSGGGSRALECTEPVTPDGDTRARMFDARPWRQALDAPRIDFDHPFANQSLRVLDESSMYQLDWHIARLHETWNMAELHASNYAPEVTESVEVSDVADVDGNLSSKLRRHVEAWEMWRQLESLDPASPSNEFGDGTHAGEMQIEIPWLRLRHLVTPWDRPISDPHVPPVLVLPGRPLTQEMPVTKPADLSPKTAAAPRVDYAADVEVASTAAATHHTGDSHLEPLDTIRDETSLESDVEPAADESAGAEAQQPAADAPSESAESPTRASTSPVAAAGAFVVALSPPLSRLLSPFALSIADGSAGGLVQAFWTWLKRRRLKRSEPDSSDADDLASLDAASLALDEEQADSPDAEQTSDFAVASAACTTGVAAIASLWRRTQRPGPVRRSQTQQFDGGATTRTSHR